MILIKTTRLQLRWMNTKDAHFVKELLNSPGWIKYIGIRNIDSIETAETYLRTKIIPNYEKFGFGFWMIERQLDMVCLGICGLIKREGLEDVDLGYALLPQYEGQGFALEAARASLEYVFNDLDLKRIVAITTQDNHRSISLLNKLGMVYEKMVTRSLFGNINASRNSA